MATVHISSILERSHRLGPRSGGRSKLPRAPSVPTGTRGSPNANAALAYFTRCGTALGGHFFKLGPCKGSRRRLSAFSRNSLRVHGDRQLACRPELNAGGLR